ncbi:MAG: hypothetical protein R3307_02655 [Anaerolineales bacterium]|nr:hypothetical protein [Anaerolineales bacterium]
MTKLSKTLLLWTFILVACSSDITSPQPFPANPPTSTSSRSPGTSVTLESLPSLQTPAISGPKIVVTVGTPHIDPGPNGEFPVPMQTSGSCAFAWANYPLEEMTCVFNAAVREINPQGSGRALAFGEDCIYQDGSKLFLAIETDFYIDLAVSDLTDYELLGNWIVQTMPVVNTMPADMIQGYQIGFVEYSFIKSEGEFLIVRVPIQVYRDSAQGRTGEELFRMFFTE